MIILIVVACTTGQPERCAVARWRCTYPNTEPHNGVGSVDPDKATP